MKLDTILVFEPKRGLKEYTEAQFLENLRLGFYDGTTIEIVETRLK